MLFPPVLLDLLIYLQVRIIRLFSLEKTDTLPGAEFFKVSVHLMIDGAPCLSLLSSAVAISPADL